MTKTLDQIVAGIPKHRARTALDRALAAVPRHRGVTLRTGLDATLARRSHDAVTMSEEFPNTVKYGGQTYYATGKHGKNRSSGELSAEYEAETSEGDKPSNRIWRTASGKIVKDAVHDRITALVSAIPDHRRGARDSGERGPFKSREEAIAAIKNLRPLGSGLQYVITAVGENYHIIIRDVPRRDNKLHIDRALRGIPDHRRGAWDDAEAEQAELDDQIEDLEEQLEEAKAKKDQGKIDRLNSELRRAQAQYRRISSDRITRMIPDHRRPARRAADALRGRLGLGRDARSAKERLRVAKEMFEQNMRSASGAAERAAIKEDYEDLVKELEAEATAESEDRARDASYLVTAKFTDSTTFRQIYEDADEAGMKYDELVADPKVESADIQDYEGDPEFSAGDASEVGSIVKFEMPFPNGKKIVRGRVTLVKPDGSLEVKIQTPGMYEGGYHVVKPSDVSDRARSLDRVLRGIPDRRRARSARDASPEEIEKEYQSLKGASKEYLAKQVMGRLSHTSAMSAPKGDLISQILNEKFSRKDLEAWGK